MKKRIIPFSLMPASWGLKGDAYKIAEASYYHDGEELERKLAEIRFKADAAGLRRSLLEIDYRYGHLDTYNYEIALAEIESDNDEAFQFKKVEIDIVHQKITPHEGGRIKAALTHPEGGVARDIAYLEVDHHFNRLTKHEFEKRRASLLEEPWIAIINSGFDLEKGIDGVFFEFDWNQKWIEFLKLNGYVGHTEDQVVDDWFTDVCRSHSAAELAGGLSPSQHFRG